MVDALQNLQVVYSKWEGRNPHMHGGRPNKPGSQSGWNQYSLPPRRVSRVNRHDSGFQRLDATSIFRLSDSFSQTLLCNASSVATTSSSLSVCLSDTFASPTETMINTDVINGLFESLFYLISGKVDVRSLAWFKSQPVALPIAVYRRPFSGRCCGCMPESKNSLYYDGLRSAGLHNVFDVDTKYDQSFWTRTFCYISFVRKSRLNHCYPDVSIAVLTSQRLIEAVHSVSQANEDDESADRLPTSPKQRDRYAKSLVKKMAAQMSNRLIRFTGWFLHKFLGRLLSSILVHRGQIHMLQQACKNGIPVVFLPTHRSHLDYILITFILFNYDINAPHVAAGDNLLIPFFGARISSVWLGLWISDKQNCILLRYLMRGLGGFFIRRKLDPVPGKKDHIYRAVLQAYIEELLHNGEFLEFFIEGQRTRSGKAVYPKSGLLSVLVDALSNDVIEDILIVPVSMSYDRLVDGNFTKEQMGEPKVYETFWRALIAIYRVLMGHYGAVRVDFSQPFSLKEFVQVYKFFPETNRIDTVTEDDKLTQHNGHTILHRIADSSMDLVSADARQMVQSLGEHIIFNAVQVQSVMSSHLLACVLLNSHRQGVTLRELIESFELLKLEVLSHNHDVGFAGETTDIVSHALNMLGSRLVKLEPSIDISLLEPEQMSLVKVIPVTTLPLVFELSYYSNVISNVFALESVVANVIHGSNERDLWMNLCPGSVVKVSRNKLLTQAADLCLILKYEYIFNPPCRSLDLVLNEALERYHNVDLLLTSDRLEEAEFCDSSIEDQLWAKRFASGLDCGFEDSDNEDEWSAPDTVYFLNTDAELMKKFWFLKRILSPILETYYVTACHLTQLFGQDMLESVFVNSLHSVLKQRVVSGVTPCGESAALDTVKNAINSYRSLRLIDCYQVAGVRMLTLVEPYSVESVLDGFIRNLEIYRD